MNIQMGIYMHLVRPDLLGHIIEELPEVIGTPAANASKQRRAIGLHRMAQELCHEIAASHLQLLVLGPGSQGHDFFHLLDLDEPSILQPAGEKWEYIKLTPAGVGDAIKFILSGRLIESSMGITIKKKKKKTYKPMSSFRIFRKCIIVTTKMSTSFRYFYPAAGF